MPLSKQQMELFRPEFEGQTTPANGIKRPVYLGLRIIKAGDVLYRGCMAKDEAGACAQLTEPRFFSITKTGAIKYAQPFSSDGVGYTAYVLKATLLVDIDLAIVTNREIMYSNKVNGMNQSWQRLNMTAITRYLSGEKIQGVWDHDGEEVLLEEPNRCLRVDRVVIR